MSLVSIILTANVIAVVLFRHDKSQARRGGWRIPEATFFILALCGASLALTFAMPLFRHKNRKGKFHWRIWLILALQIVLLVLLALNILSLPPFVTKLLQL